MLGELNLADMLDVIHVFYEENMVPRYENEIEIRDAVRTQVYQLLYEQEYNYAVKSRSTNLTEPPPMPTESDLPPEAMPTKPFIPATNPDDFASILDGPMGY